MVSWDLHFFKEMTDHEAIGCDRFFDCVENGFFYIPESWKEGITSSEDTHDCNCRPEWYLKKMKEEYV